MSNSEVSISVTVLQMHNHLLNNFNDFDFCINQMALDTEH
jgi:hypothetical protein